MLKEIVYSTKYSQAVTHPSTNLAQRCLTSVIGRELVHSTWYGRRHYMLENLAFLKTYFSKTLRNLAPGIIQICYIALDVQDNSKF